MAATVIRTGRMPRVFTPHVGIAAVPALPTTLVVVSGASGIAARLGHPSGTEIVAFSAAVVVTPRIGPAAVGGRPGTVLTGSRALPPLGAARRSRCS